MNDATPRMSPERPNALELVTKLPNFSVDISIRPPYALKRERVWTTRNKDCKICKECQEEIIFCKE